MIQSVVAIGSGGLFGAGPGASAQKYFYLPQSGTDFIFAIIGEEFGFMGALVVITLFAGILWFGLRIAMRTRDMFSSLVACGATLYLALQAVIHIAVTTGSARQGDYASLCQHGWVLTRGVHDGHRADHGGGPSGLSRGRRRMRARPCNRCRRGTISTGSHGGQRCCRRP